MILATGSAYRELGLPNEKRLSGHGVSWCATCDGFFFKDQDIVVVGGGDSAVEEATFLTRFARSVTLIHRRDTLRASKIMQHRALADPKLSFRWNSHVVDVLGETKVSGVVLADTVTGSSPTWRSPACSSPSATTRAPSLVADQVELDPTATSASHRTTRTSLPGVFACGDVVDHTYRQAITAAGTGCAAALDAERHLAATTLRLRPADVDPRGVPARGT